MRIVVLVLKCDVVRFISWGIVIPTKITSKVLCNVVLLFKEPTILICAHGRVHKTGHSSCDTWMNNKTADNKLNSSSVQNYVQ